MTRRPYLSGEAELSHRYGIYARIEWIKTREVIR